MRLSAVTIGRERQIRGYERARASQHKDKQQNCEHKAGHATDQTKCRS